MEQLTDSYNSITSKIRSYQTRISLNEKRIRDLESGLADGVSGRIRELQATLARIEEYLLQVRKYIDLAERHMTSRNELTIEAPEGYRVNLARLKRWASMIDPLSSDDQYARRLHLAAKCDELFLRKKQTELQDRIKELETETGGGSSDEAEQLKAENEAMSNELREFIMSAEVYDFIKAMQDAEDKA